MNVPTKEKLHVVQKDTMKTDGYTETYSITETTTGYLLHRSGKMMQHPASKRKRNIAHIKIYNMLKLTIKCR